MTNLEALQSLTEYRSNDDNLFEKSLLDRGITSSDTYAAANEQEIDLTMADIYLYLAGLPERAEGRWSVKYPIETLRSLRRDLYSKWGIALPEISQVNALKINGRTSSDTALW